MTQYFYAINDGDKYNLRFMDAQNGVEHSKHIANLTDIKSEGVAALIKTLNLAGGYSLPADFVPIRATFYGDGY